MEITIYLNNNDTYGNNVHVVDRHAGNASVFNGWIDAGATREIPCKQSDAGFGDIATSIDGGPWTGRALLYPGQTVYLY